MALAEGHLWAPAAFDDPCALKWQGHDFVLRIAARGGLTYFGRTHTWPRRSYSR
jgi:hypothetical protein